MSNFFFELCVGVAAAMINPVSQVTGLVQDLHTKVTADADSEVDAFQMLSERCEDQTQDAATSRKPSLRELLPQRPMSRTMPPDRIVGLGAHRSECRERKRDEGLQQL